MLRCGLLGQKLGHSYSPAIHSLLGDYEYKLYEVQPEDVEAFLRSDAFDALNVTIPYKKTAAALCDELSETAAAIGSANTLVRRADGTLFGDNTDVYGFEEMLRRADISPEGKKVLVLGSGGASVAVTYALRRQKAREVVIISRTGENNYTNLSRHKDADLIVNATPVGMYPDCGETLLDLTEFPACDAVVDIIYNPVRTALLLQAEKLGLRTAGGLTMLAAQAVRSAERFTGAAISDDAIDRAVRYVSSQTMNIVIVGMPGSGKTSVSEALGKMLSRRVADTDAQVTLDTGETPEQIILSRGESAFRAVETEAVRHCGASFGTIIATGGGVPLREENYAPLHQNGIIFWLQRDLNKLAREGRPLSQSADMQALYNAREPRYRRFADFVIDNNRRIEDAAQDILKVIE